MRRTRRRTSIFSISSFDPDDLSFNVSDNDEDYKREKETDDETRIEEIDLEKRVGELEKKEIESKSDAFREVIMFFQWLTSSIFSFHSNDILLNLTLHNLLFGRSQISASSLFFAEILLKFFPGGY